MRLYQRHEEGRLTQDDLVRALILIASYLVRRSVLGLQTRNYWATFARIAHSVTMEAPFASFQVAMARQSYKFPADREFEEAVAADLKAAAASTADDQPTLAWGSYIYDEPADIATFTVTAGGSR